MGCDSDMFHAAVCNDPASYRTVRLPEFSSHERRALQDAANILSAHAYPSTDFRRALWDATKSTENNSTEKEGVFV